MLRPRTTRSTLSSWVLLLLAIGPIVGVAWLSVQSWNRTGHELSDLDARVRPVSAAYRSYEFSNLLSRTTATLGAAALPEADPALFPLAEDHIEVFNDAWVELARDLEPLVSDIAVELDQTPEDALTMANFARDLAVGELRLTEPGDRPSDTLTFIVAAARDQLAVFVAPGVTTGDDRVRDAEERLIGLIALDADFDHDLEILTKAGLDGVPVDQAKLRSYDLRRIVWDDSASSWMPTSLTFGTQAVDRTGASAGRPAGSASQNDPVTNIIDKLTELSLDGEDLSTPMLTAFDVDTQLNQQLADAHQNVLDTAADVRSELRRGRNLAAGAGVLMLLLGCALFGLTLNETRARRKVAAAHQDALAEMERKAHRDPTTGLHNRRWLDDGIPAALAARTPGTEIALAYIDLDRFKSINDVWGHHVGDQVLQIVGKRLTAFSWEDRAVKVARFGGDEFVGFVEVPSDMSLDHVVGLGDALIETISEPVAIDQQRHDIDASVGVTVSALPSTARTLLLEADTALLEAKRTQRGRTNVYDRTHSRVGELMQALPEALSSGEISVHLQPVCDTATGLVRHYEALARWTRPNGESVRPDIFVSLAESFGLAESLTRAVLLNVRELRNNLGDDLPRIWINVSPVEFNGRRIGERILAMLDELGIPTTQIGIEVTESAAIGDQVSTARELAKLRGRGVKVAIDDFGAGYSPLGHLRQLPIDLLKIDRSLIDNIDRDPGAQMMVAGIVGFAQGLDIEVLAEGVERPEELAFISAQGIPLVQGYLLGRPVPPSEIDWNASTLADEPHDHTSDHPSEDSSQEPASAGHRST